MHRKIRKVAVLGSGVMGSKIACHFAHTGLEVLLLDIVPQDLPEESKKNTTARNKIVDTALAAAIKSSPSPIYKPSFLVNIQTGNFEDDMAKITQCDWVIEVVIENLAIKQSIFDLVEKYRKPGTLITSNTSGIPISSMLEGRSEDFKQHFCGTHFFNPPRYLPLFEIIPSAHTTKEVIEFFQDYAPRYLGKTAVLCKDTPAFIANRVGVFSMMAVFHLMVEMNLRIDEVDALTGPLTGKPKSASFRTGDVVGLDTLVKVASGVYQQCPSDEQRTLFQIPTFIDTMVNNKWLGDKTGQGFYKMDKSTGKKEIYTLDWKTMDYVPQQKYHSATTEQKSIENLPQRLKKINSLDEPHSTFLKKLHLLIFSYVSFRIPEIADDLYLVDDAMKAGFGWELGPFEQWDVLGVKEMVDEMKKANIGYAKWVDDFIHDGNVTYYINKDEVVYYYDIATKSYKIPKGKEGVISFDILRPQKTIWKNSGSSILDIGDGVIAVEFQTKMNAIGGEVMEGLNKAIDIAEGNYKGIVIGNHAPTFSAGANLAMIFMMALEQEYDELDMTVRMFQNTVMRLRHSAIPVVAAPHGLTLGGGCEIVMHCDAAIIHAETYAGLVEVGVGLLPAGGGTKEFALRLSDSIKPGDPILPALGERFTAIATAKTSTSAHEGFDIGVFDAKKDHIVINISTQLEMAKKQVIALADAGYVQPKRRNDIQVMGRTGLAGLYAGLAGFEIGGYATAHDKKIAEKIAWVLCGGDLSAPSQVTDQYLLDLEREAFLSLLGEKKTLERIESLLKTGKPLRN
jgi:3-hydroxyacyl-CoA dehydrogenase